MSDMSDQELDKMLGIVRPETPARSTPVREAAPGARADALLDRALGINVTESEQADAQRQLEETDRHPWRIEWGGVLERHSRRGEEAHLTELYMTRLGESQAAAEAHVHRELSAAWTQHRSPAQRLAAVAETLASERQRMEAKTPLAEARNTTSTQRTGHPSRGRTINVNEYRRQGRI